MFPNGRDTAGRVLVQKLILAGPARAGITLLHSDKDVIYSYNHALTAVSHRVRLCCTSVNTCDTVCRT